MKILIPFSGGINSTYSLYRWLTETDADIVARYSYEEFESKEYNSKQSNKLKDIVLFLKSETRDFNFERINWPNNYVKERVPIRQGFIRGTYDIGSIKPRFQGYPIWIKETCVDAISIGISLENTSTCGYDVLRKYPESAGVDIYLAGVKELVPVSIGDDFNYDEVAKHMIGRFEQYEFLPKELQDLCIRYDSESRNGRETAYWQTYKKFVGEGKTGRDFDLHCAKHGSYGPWRHEADPETYMYRGRNEDGKLPYLIYE